LHTPFIKRHNHHLFLGRGARSPSQRTAQLIGYGAATRLKKAHFRDACVLPILEPIGCFVYRENGAELSKVQTVEQASGRGAALPAEEEFTTTV